MDADHTEHTEHTDNLELLERHAPIVRFNEGEYFLPASVESFVARAELWERTGPGQRRLVAASGTLDLDGLVQLTRGRTAQHHLRLVSRPLPRADLVAWRLDRDRPRFRSHSRLGRVGVLARFIDVGSRLSLLLRGRVPTGAQSAAAVLDRQRPDHGDHPYYGRVLRSAGYVVLQYWFFSYFNDWRSRAHGVDDHEGDWAGHGRAGPDVAGPVPITGVGRVLGPRRGGGRPAAPVGRPGPDRGRRPPGRLRRARVARGGLPARGVPRLRPRHPLHLGRPAGPSAVAGARAAVAA